MNKLVLAAILACLFMVIGCKDDNEEPKTPIVNRIWPRGSYPVPSPVDARILFTQEETPAGLYLLDADNAVQLNPSGPEARPDYAWSGEALRIAFSSPGVAGEGETGIWISTAGNLSDLRHIWDRGSHPRFLPNEPFLICAGPEGDSTAEGIWQMDFSGARSQLLNKGVDPEVSPDGFHIAYLLTTGSSNGRTLIKYHRVSHFQDTVAVNVLRYSWLGDSQTLVYETVQNSVQEINFVRPDDDIFGILIAPGTSPAGNSSSTEFVYASMSGDQLNGIYLASVSTSPRRLSNVGTAPRFAGANRVIAFDAEGLIEITY